MLGWCDACIPSVGKKASWVVLFASDAQIAAASKNAWIGGVYMGISVGVVVSVWVFVASNEILYNFRKRMFRLGTD